MKIIKDLTEVQSKASFDVVELTESLKGILAKELNELTWFIPPSKLEITANELLLTTESIVDRVSKLHNDVNLIVYRANQVSTVPVASVIPVLESLYSILEGWDRAFFNPKERAQIMNAADYLQSLKSE